MSTTRSPHTWLSIEDGEDLLFAPDMTQEEAFALFDEFYGTSPPRSAAPSPPPEPPPGFGEEDEFAGLMENIEEVERFSQMPDSDLPMHNAAPSPEPELLPSKLTAATTPDFTSVLPTHDTSTSLPTETQPKKAPPVISPAPTREPEIRQDKQFQTPTLPAVIRMMDSTRGSSVAPSTGGHRSSMQGEMREEEEELSNAPLEDIPPFPGYEGRGHLNDDAIESLLAEDHQQDAHDLSSPRDVDEEQVAGLLKHSPKQEAPTPLPSPDTAPVASTELPLGPVAPKNLKRGRQLSPSSTAPVKKARHLSPGASSQKSSKDFKVTNLTNLEESDSSLTDVSLSALDLSLAAIQDTSAEQFDEQLQAAALEAGSPRESVKERKDSFATSLRDFKSEVPSSPATHEDSPAKKQAKPKATPKRKRTDTSATSASPAPSKAAKITKTASTRPKARNAIGKSDLKGLIGSKVLNGVLKNKGPRQTRGQQKALEEAKPDAAGAARSRHTERVDYKE